MSGLYGDTQHGRVLSVRDEILGDHLSADAVATDTTIYLDDLSVFTESGGQVLLVEDAAANELVTYIGFTAAEDGLVLSAGLAANHAVGTSAQVYPQKTNRIAHVQVDDPEREPIPVRVPFSLKDRVPLGPRSDLVGEGDDTASTPEEALIHLEHREWVLADVPRQDVAVELGAIDVTRGRRDVIDVYTEFLSPITNLQSNDFAANFSTTGFVTADTTPEGGHRGVWVFHTGADPGGSARVTTHLGTTYLGAGRIRVGCLMKVPGNLSDGTNRYTLYFGLNNDGLESAITDGIYMRYRDNLNGGDWQGRITNDGVSSNHVLSDNGGAIVVAGSTYYLLEIEVSSAGDQADFYINSALKGSLTGAALPTNADPVEIRAGIEKVAGTTDRAMNLDYIYYYEALSAPR